MAGKQGGMDGCSNGGSTERKAEEAVARAAGCSAGEKPADAAAAVASDVSYSEGKETPASPELASTGVSHGEDPVDGEEEEEEEEEDDDEGPVPEGKCYMAKAAVERFLAHKRTPYVFSDKIVSPAGRRFELELAAAHEEFEDRYAAFQARIREEYEANGYVALPDDYEERRAEINAEGEAIFLRVLGPPPAEDESDEED